MSIAAIIPARYASTRFPAKPLARDTGKYLIEHVYEQVRKADTLDKVLVATDDQRIADACESFGAEYVMTRTDHQCGTDRLAEVAEKHPEIDLVVNVQGDEPEIDPGSIDLLVNLILQDKSAEMATLCAVIEDEQEVSDPNVVKVVLNKNNHALYFSRSTIPYNRDGNNWQGMYRKHLGIYAYRRDFILNFSRLDPTPLECTEKLEQLRALENGYTIAVGEVSHTAVGIDTPEQYAEFVKRYEKSKK